MLLNNFYTIDRFVAGEGKISAELTINAGHHIFEGHFPGQPVTPGVCMLQMVKELLEKETGKSSQLKKADEMKFLAIIDPQRDPNIVAEISYTINEDILQATAIFTNNASTSFKFKGSFVQV